MPSPDQLSPVAVSSVDDISLDDRLGSQRLLRDLGSGGEHICVAALILAANPNLTPAAVEQYMQETALPMADSAVSGAGLVQIDTALQFAADAVEKICNSSTLFSATTATARRRETKSKIISSRKAISRRHLQL